jgi:hypothetical protein
MDSIVAPVKSTRTDAGSIGYDSGRTHNGYLESFRANGVPDVNHAWPARSLRSQRAAALPRWPPPEVAVSLLRRGNVIGRRSLPCPA